MNRNPSFLFPSKIDTVRRDSSLGDYPTLDQSIWLGAILLSKIKGPFREPGWVLPREGASKIVTESGGVVKIKIGKNLKYLLLNIYFH
jgi:hypothetical protein